jgi:hypothetical protein
MRKFLLPLAASALMGLGFAAAPASAAPTSGVQIATPDAGVSEVRMTRREMRRRHMMRRSTMGSRSRPSQAGNARDPNRPVMQQQQGQTTGGPSR